MALQDSFERMLDLVSGSNDPILLKSVIEVQRELSALEEENRKLRQEIHDLKNKRLLETELEYRNNAYFKKNNKEIPYCSRCYNVDERLVIMTKNVLPLISTTYTFECPECKRQYDSEILHHVNVDINF
ncbi:hypothetical protein [Vagococcus lutrae]|uniref:hypothetical protein n=1 Tax=Vagococcus lutrae TaxID=81947 RepID=UPI00288E9C9D|nr:hypothetical protein [Vagococcus lutrae]MDT2805254.1 hypothetical protein [Vagococcus lutrae]